MEYHAKNQTMSPTAQVFSHVLKKGFEAGGLIGTFTVIPVSAAYTSWYRKSSVDMLQLVRSAGISCVYGVGLSGDACQSLQ